MTELNKDVRRHPAEKALHVWRTLQPLDRKRKQEPKQYLDPESLDGRIFARLMNSNCLLKDPVQELIYPGLKRARTKKTGKGKSIPITVPTCCSMHQEEVSNIWEKHSSFLYNSPTPSLPKISQSQDGSKGSDKLEQQSNANHWSNSRRQLPISTVVARWRNSGHSGLIRAYNTDTLYSIMSEFGPITSIYTTSPCSAYVVFLNLSDSCDVIGDRTLGRSDNRLYCYWLHPNMSNKLFYLNKAGLQFHHDPYILPYK